MLPFVSGKQSLLILLAGLCAAAASALTLHHLLAGPRLGPVYDLLRDCRSPPPVSREIVLIDTGELAESGDVFTVLMTLSELDAAGLVIAVPALGSSAGRTMNNEEIRRRFTDEYVLLGRNIRNLFEAIRVGSVSPAESAGYVENLVALAEQGRDRLTAALIRQDEAGSVQIARASAVFGSVLEATDLRANAAAGSPWYARPRPDRDGKLRRIAPLSSVSEKPVPEGAELAETGRDTGHIESGTIAVSPVEHIVYRILKPRWAESAIEYTERGPVLALRGGGQERRIPLDRDGNILFEKPRHEGGFRRLALARFREYEEAGRAMRGLLLDAEALGAYSQTRPERIPLILCDYAASLREDLLTPSTQTPESQKRAGWIAARTEYLNSLEELLYGPSEMILVNGFEEIIATETLKDEGLARLQTLRDELIRSFVAMREQHRRLLEIRNLLAESLAASLCIMGPAAGGEAGPVESSALLANSLLTGSHIIPGQGRYILFWSIAAACIILLCIHALRPAAALIAGIAAAFLSAVVFGWSFIISGYWIDPFIPAVSILAGTLLMFIIKFAIMSRGARRFRLAYGPAVNKSCLKELIRSGRPLLSETIAVPAAVIAVKDPLLYGHDDPLQAARASAEFRGAAAAAFKQAGAVIFAYEGDTVLACFGSPPERLCMGECGFAAAARSAAAASSADGASPATRAGGFVTDLLRQAPRPWYFGIDCGECAFSWSGETGYTANGSPVARARLLASLAPRYRAQVIITASVREQLARPVRKLKPLGQDGADLYELCHPSGTDT